MNAAYLSRKRHGAGPSGAANPAVWRYPVRAPRPLPTAPTDGVADLPYPYFMSPGADPAINGGALCAY